jgi:rhomboid protease GluP
VNTPSVYPNPVDAVRPQEPVQPTLVKVNVPQVKPTMTYGIMAVTVVIFALQMLSQYTLQGVDLPFYYGGKINQFILQGQLWRLITPVFLHGSILHIAFNMYALYSLGTSLERVYGHGRFALLYFLAGFAGNAASFMLSANPSLGSSTAVFGLVAAQGVFMFQNRKLFGSERARSAILNTLSIVVINLFIGLTPGSNIDNWGHVGGLLGGLLFAWLGGPLWKIEGIAPAYQVVDQRQSTQVQLASAAVLLVFGLIAAARFFMN